MRHKGESQLEKAMARRLVSFTEGSYYHIYNRGAGRQKIFLSEDNYAFAMKRISAYSRTTAVKVAACRLMPNHYHFLLHQTSAMAAGYLVQQVFNSYTKAFNRMYDRTGTLFESPFKAKVVDKRKKFSFDPDFAVEYFGSAAEYEQFVHGFDSTKNRDDKLFEYLF